MSRHPKRPKKVRVEIYLTQDQFEELGQFAYVLDCSSSQVVRTALDYLAGRGLVDPRTRISQAGDVTHLSGNKGKEDTP